MSFVQFLLSLPPPRHNYSSYRKSSLPVHRARPMQISVQKHLPNSEEAAHDFSDLLTNRALSGLRSRFLGLEKQPGMHLIHWTAKQTNHHPCYTIYRLQGKTWKATAQAKNTTYTDKKPAPQPNTVSGAYRITNGKKIYDLYSSVRTVGYYNIKTP